MDSAEDDQASLREVGPSEGTIAAPDMLSMSSRILERTGLSFDEYIRASGAWPGETEVMHINPEDPNDAGIVTQIFFLQAEKVSIEEAKRRVRARATSLASNFNKLHELVVRHENLIRSRWLKKSGPQREKALLEAWPGMSPHHRPDLRAYRAAKGVISAKTRDAYMFPHINIEDLKGGSSLLRLLNSRSRNPPAVFTALDLDTIHIGIWSDVIQPIYFIAEGHPDADASISDTYPSSDSESGIGQEEDKYETPYRIDFKSRSVERYGRVRRYRASRAKTKRGELPNVPEGLLALEIQDRILEFLLKFCQGTLHDRIVKGDLLSDPILPEPPTLSVGDGEWASTSDFARDTQYLVPGEPNLQGLLSLVQSRVDEWKDYALAMREDPQFFADVVGDWFEHHPAWIKDEEGKIDPVLRTALRKRAFWDDIVASAVNGIYYDALLWRYIKDQLDEVIAIKGQQEFRLGEEPQAYLDALGRIRLMLDLQVILNAKKELLRRWPASPPVRSLFVRNSNSGKMDIRKDFDEKDDLWWLMERARDSVESDIPDHILAAELCRLMQTDQKQKNGITPFVARFIADLGLACEVKRQLRLLCPRVFFLRGKPLGVKKEEDNRLLTQAVPACSRYLTELLRANAPARSKDTNFKLGAEGDPTSGRFHYPADKRRTKENNEAMQKAEENLDAFWHKFDTTLRSRVPAQSYEALQQCMPTREEIQRTPDWVELEETPVTVTISEDPADARLTFGTYEDEKLSYRTAALNITSKKKSRGQPDSGPDPARQEPAARAAAAAAAAATAPGRSKPEPLFRLKKRQYRVFSTLFYRPSVHTVPGEILWMDYVNALTTIGFVAEKLYGSVWRFRPGSETKLGVENPINFHEPHPQDKLPFRTARRYGRRLGRMYGLGAENFALARE